MRVLDDVFGPIFQSTLPVGEATCQGLPHSRSFPYFNPRFPRGKRLYRHSFLTLNYRFQSTLPAREATVRIYLYFVIIGISIHASREGSDEEQDELIAEENRFQSTLPAREATGVLLAFRRGAEDFNPRFPRGKRLKDFIVVTSSGSISIHASREGSDRFIGLGCNQPFLFQSTLPAREATFGSHTKLAAYCDFNPRFPRGKRPDCRRRHNGLCGISIHASREGSDTPSLSTVTWNGIFQSTLPARAATFFTAVVDVDTDISIHASREGSDGMVRGSRSHDHGISIHASREGSDVYCKNVLRPRSYFNPRFPRGKRRIARHLFVFESLFQSTLPAREATVR